MTDLFEFDYSNSMATFSIHKNIEYIVEKEIIEKLNIDDLDFFIYKLKLDDLIIKNKHEEIMQSVINKNMKDYYNKNL